MLTCPSPIVLSMHADGALTPEERAALEKHAKTCATCAAWLAQLANERVALRAALLEIDEQVRVPAFARPLGATRLALLFAGALATGWLASTVWSAVAALVPSGLRWLNPFDSGSQIDWLITTVIYFATEGAAMFTSIAQLMGTVLFVAFAVWLAMSLGRHRGAAVAASLLALALIVPGLGHALEVRHGDFLTVPASETIDDTLIAVGKNVTIEGNVTGDLIAFASRVIVHGNVGGNVISGAETVSIDGTVGGSVLGMGRAVDVGSPKIARDLYAFGRDITVAPATQIGGNASAFGSSIDVGGSVGTDLLGFGGDVTVGGSVQRNFDTRAQKVTVLSAARIGGNVTAHLNKPEDLDIASGATIGGNVDRQIVENSGGGFGARAKPVNRYLTASFYFGQAVRLGAAFLTGLLLLWLFPSLRTLPLRTGEEIGKALGIGLVAAIVLPVAAVIACITIIGIPIGLIGFVLWLLGLYFAKTVVAQLIGRMLFRSDRGVPHYAATLLAGLVIVLIAVNLPYVGWILNALLGLAGLGMLVGHMLGRWNEQPSEI